MAAPQQDAPTEGSLYGSQPVQYRNPYIYFAVANFIALLVGGGIYLFFLEAHFLDAPLDWFNAFLFEYKGLAVIAATSPLVAGMLVGFGYARRGKARRAREAAEAARLAEAAVAADGA